MTNLLLWGAGMALLGLAAWRARAPFARLRELDRLAQNARRYDSWRGGRNATAAGDQTSGADVMRQLLRRRVYLWVGLGIVGVIVIVAGFVVR